MRGIGAGQDGSAVHGLRGVLPSQFEDALAQFHPGHRDTLQFESSVSASRVAFDDTRFFKVANQTAGLHLKTQALWLIRHRDTLKSMLPVVEHLQWAIDETLLITNRIKGSLLREALLVGDSQQAAATFGRALEALQTRFYVLQAQSASAKMLPHILRRTVDRLVAHYFWSREGIQVPLYSERFVCNGTEFGGSLASLRDLTLTIDSLENQGGIAAVIHGDPHLGNIIASDEGPIFIDPRGGIEPFGDVFDIAYDIGKILQDLRSLYGLCVDGHVVVVPTGPIGHFEVRCINASALARYHREFLRTLSWISELSSDLADRTLLTRSLVYEALLLSGVVPFHHGNPRMGTAVTVLGALALDAAAKCLRHGAITETEVMPYVVSPAHALYRAFDRPQT